MKKLLFLLLSISLASQLSAQTNLYKHPDFKEIAKSHKTIAIVPFITQVKLRPNQMKNMSERDLHKLERAEGEGIQNAMFSWFLKRKKRGTLKIDVQDPQRTNAILFKNGIDYNNLQDHLTEDLAKMLGVDAVISGDLETDKPISEGVSIAFGVAFGLWGSPTNSAIINMKVHNGEDANLLWNYNKRLNGRIGSTPESLVHVLMRKASRRLAYTKALPFI